MNYLEWLEEESKRIKEFNEGYGKLHNIILHDPNPRVKEESIKRFLEQQRR